LHTWCGLSANLGCRSETCRTWLAWNAGPKKIAKKLRSGHHSTTLSGYIFASKAPIDNWKKKTVKQQCLPRCPHTSQYGEHRFTSRWDLLASLGQPTNFNRFHVLPRSWQRYCMALAL